MSLAVIHRNVVNLVGRLSAAAAERVLPSGDTVVCWRLIVTRPLDPSRSSTAADTIDCVARTPGQGRRALAWISGDTLEINGALHRRFWRGPEGVRSRYEVDVLTARRVAKAPVQARDQVSSA